MDQLGFNNAIRICLLAVILYAGYTIFNELFLAEDALMFTDEQTSYRFYYFIRFTAILTFLYFVIRVFVKSKN